MKMKPITTSEEAEQEFLRIFSALSQRYSSWGVWQDFVFMGAAAIANAVDKRPGIWHKRENEYLSIAKKYKKSELSEIIQLFALTVTALTLNPAQDFLGKLYMRLELSNHWHGQFFTPWHISELMAMVIAGEDLKERIAASGYISVNDPACGAGGMMLAFANVCVSQGVNYQESVLFVGQDVDPVVAKMCYIQASLLGCAGYVIIGNTLTEPAEGTTLSPSYKRPESLWFTPLYYLPVWETRRELEKAELFGRKEAAHTPEKPPETTVRRLTGGNQTPTFRIQNFLGEGDTDE